MNDQPNHAERVRMLVSQDHGVNLDELKESRMQIETSLDHWERRGKLVRKVTWIAGGLVLAELLAILPIEALPALRHSGVAHLTWSIVFGISLFIAGACLVWYRDRYRPAIRRSQFELQMSMIRELQNEVAQLRQQLERRQD